MKAGRPRPGVAWSKFDPHAPSPQADAATDASAQRRARLLKWANWVVYAFTMVGFGFLAWTLLKA